ncbi:DUF45 domain-containing protein [Methanomassiliicoccales archaeon LGM-RCC1]|nr:DUF45 domain-containing protein [Methanomassiliicoccales archaeon LGM-RCC1]
MRDVDVTSRIRPLDMYPYDSYKVILKGKMHLHYAYRITGEAIEIELSDYLKDAPDNVLSDECKAIVAWSRGKRYKQSPLLTEYILSPDFIVKSRPIFLQRTRSLKLTEQGKCKNLLDSVERLRDMELIFDDDIRNSYFSWADHMQKYKWGQCNQFFRVVSVNPLLDDDSVPDLVLDFVIYHEILHLRQDMSKAHRPHNAQFRSWEHLFPEYDACEEYLRTFYSRKRLH